MGATAPGLGKIDPMKDRIWLEIVPDSIPDVLNNSYLGKSIGADIRAEMLAVFAQADNKMYLPLSGMVPTITFENTYAKATPELGVKTRATAAVFSGLLGSVRNMIAGLDIGEGARREALQRKVSEFFNSARSFVGTFAGQLDSPKIWEGYTVSPLELTIQTGLESVYEHNYYRYTQWLLQMMTTPNEGNSIDASELRKLIQQGGANAQDLANLKLYSHNAPKAVCEMSIIVGRAAPLTKAKQAIQLQTDYTLSSGSTQRPLVKIPKCVVSRASITHGTDDGRGIDSLGMSRIISGSLAFTPLTVQDVVEGMIEVMDQANLPLVATELAVLDQLDKTSPESLTRAAMYYLFNVGTVAASVTAEGVRTVRASNPANFTGLMTRRSPESLLGARLLI